MNEEKNAEYFAKQQKEISVSEFFEKNKHLLGFDNPTKALLMIVKEGVDNSLDACEEAGILPNIEVKLKNIKNNIFRVSVKDNGPGIVKNQIPKIFGKLLYGSKFHRLRQSRGQQGIGISAAVLYAQLTTGNPIKIWSRTSKKSKVHYFELFIDSTKNEPEVVKEESIEIKKFPAGHGTLIELDVSGRYRKSQGVKEYLKETAIANPFAKIVFHAPDGEKMVFSRSVDRLPKQPKEINPHPHGIELGILIRMLKNTKAKTVASFLKNEFSSVGTKSANEICKLAKIKKTLSPKKFTRADVENLLRGMQQVNVQRPPLDCLSPIGSKELKKSLEKHYPDAETIVTLTREPSVYRGNPFQIEVGIVYGVGKKESQIKIMRFANRVPLLYQAGAGAVVEAVKNIGWKRYGLQQSGNNLPTGPMVLVVHMASSWVPFISESKEAISTYPDIIKEIKLAVQTCARDLKIFINKKQKAKREEKRLHIFENYFPLILESASQLAEEEPNDLKAPMELLLKKIGKKIGEENDKKSNS